MVDRTLCLVSAIALSSCGGEVLGGEGEGADVATTDGRTQVGDLYGSSATHDLDLVGTWMLAQTDGQMKSRRFEITFQPDGTLVTKTNQSRLVYDDERGDHEQPDEPELLGTSCVVAGRWRSIGRDRLGLLASCPGDRLAEAVIAVPGDAISASVRGDFVDVSLVSLGERYPSPVLMRLERR